ncbi:MAG: hypothetical protein AB8B85_15745 [Paracoccaceae bacterium]
MSDNKKPEQDIVATEVNEPEMITDEALEDVDGGYRYELKNVMVSSYNFSGSAGGQAETITANFGNIADTIYGGSEIDTLGALRKRPAR